MLLIYLLFVSSVESSVSNFSWIRNKRQADFLRQNVESFAVVHPQRVTALGELLSKDVRHRVKRKQPEILHYRVPLSDGTLHLALEHNSRVLAPGFVVERRRQNGSTSIKRHEGIESHCLFRGVVNGTENSYVAVATCNGINGLIHTGNDDLFIEPVKGHQPNEIDGHPHLVYKRSSLRNARSLGTCGVSDLSENRSQHSTDGQSEPTNGTSEARTERRKRTKRKRSVSVERNVETLIVADKEMVEYYVDEDIETYILTILNMVSTLYHDASIGNAINIVLVRVMLLESQDSENAADRLIVNQHADETLKSFCKWQKSINPKDETHPNHHDVAILLTRHNICSRLAEPCSTLGLAEVAGMCQPLRSCNVNQDTGLALAYTIAHEVGHNFGMSHDSPENGCEAPLGEKQHVMSPHLNSDASPFVWSNCSRWEITNFLDRDWGSCLDDEPTDHEFSFPELPPGAMYDVHHQCRLQYGADAEFCHDIEDVCQTLWCRQQNKCVTRLEPAAEGTICGKNMWCSMGECVPITERPTAIDGEWGPWSSWSPCSRSCGGGVQSSARDCNNPVPAWGGRFCIGERKRFKMCNTDKCPENSISYRAQQCKQFNDVPYKDELHSWLPVSTPLTPCQLHCKPEGQFFSVMLADAVKDGTECNPGTRDVCINGKCRHVSCDWGIDSAATEDRCGVCHGDGTLCRTVKGEFATKNGVGYVTVVSIPAEARNILVEEVRETTNYIAVQGENGRFYLNGQWFIQWSGEYEAAGSTFYYLREGEREILKVPGPIRERLRILLLYQTENPGLIFEYTIPNKNTTRKPEFKWSHAEWTICSKTCGGGIKISKVVCKEKEAGVVEDNYCNSESKPSQRTRVCNKQKCPAEWWSGPWQKCVGYCGKSGVRRRTVICIRSLGSDVRIALPKKDCHASKRPKDHETCRNAACPTDNGWAAGEWNDVCRGEPCNFQSRHVYCSRGPGKCDEKLRPSSKRQCSNVTCGKWIVGSWSQCSATCGEGTRHRNVSCVGGAVCHRSTEPASTVRCRMRRCSKTEQAPPAEDDDQLGDMANFIPVSESAAKNERTRKHRLRPIAPKPETTSAAPIRPEEVAKDVIYHPIYEIANLLPSN